LAIVILIAAVLVVGVILYQGYRAADELSNEQLIARANELARLARPHPTGEPGLDLPPKLEQTYRPPGGADLFVVQDERGWVIDASSTEFSNAASSLSIPGKAPMYFRLEQFGPNEEDYYGIRMRLNSAVGTLLVTVARASDADALVHALLRALIRQIAWVIPLFAIATLAIAVWSIRRGLQPILAISAQAAEISPAAVTVRLSGDDLPSEIEPLVRAVNQALDRLEKGFATQRQFTANAAHELRTPLAILTAGLDNLGKSTALEKLQMDVDRMNRLVDQLLRVARLDALPLDVNQQVDLRATVAKVVEYLAPWAVAQGRSLGFEAPDGTVPVQGNADAISDAVRNVIENAVSHTRSGTEVAISVTAIGAVSVSDQGPGIPIADRVRVFDRFWRGQGQRGSGAGLGLAIVAEVARAHGATVNIGEAPGGGTMLTIRFRRADMANGEGRVEQGL
jgi:signal transduction histidine kinase